MSTTLLSDFEVILLAVQRLGIHKTAEVLRQALERESWLSNKDAHFVLDMVSVAFKVPAEEIRFGVTRKNDRRDAIGFCAYYLRRELGYSTQEVAWMLNRSEDLCYKYATMISKLDPRRQTDKKYVQWRKLFDGKIAKYKLTLSPEKKVLNEP